MRLIRVPATPEGLRGVRDLRRRLASRPRDETQTVEQRRMALVAATSGAADLPVTLEHLDGVAVERHSPIGDAGDGAVLFAHGGAFVIGSAATHRGLAASIASALGEPLFSVDYRLAPEHPFPAARDDLVAAYAGLVGRGGPVAVIGDSAGGGLVMQGLLEIRRRGLPMPSAVVVVSPWIDLACAHAGNGRGEAMLSAAGLRLDSLRYRGGREVADPELDVLHADLRDLPPTLIQVGEHEILHDDAIRLAERLAAAGVFVELQIWEGMIHAWQAFRGIVPEAEAAIAQLAAFVNGNWHSSPAEAGHRRGAG